MFFGLYAGDDGQSHLEELDLDAGEVGWHAMQPATGITFRRSEPGAFIDFHPAPRRQWVITLSGQVEIGTGDGSVQLFGPGDAMLAEDVSGRGHTTRVVSDEPRVSAAIPVN